jgi:hypothetical protein
MSRVCFVKDFSVDNPFICTPSRKYVHSFFADRNVLSMNLGGGIVGCIALFYMDELFAVCQVCACTSYKFFNVIEYKDIL